MAIQSTMGIKALFVAPINSADPKKMPTSGWRKIEVYQDSCTFVDKDPTITTHKSETSSLKITQKSDEGSELKFSIMDPSIDERVLFQGGSKGTSGTPPKASYLTPDTVKNIQLAIKIVPVDGLVLNIASATISAKNNTTYSSKGITLLEVTAEPASGYEISEDSVEPTV